MKKHLTTIALSALMLIGGVTISIAQPGPGSGGPGPGGTTPADVTPIDGGVGLLVVSGFVYAGAKLVRGTRRWA